MSKPVAYYHIYLTDDNAAWSTIFMEQMKCMEDSGLLNYLDRIEVTCVTPNDGRINEFINLCDTYSATFVIDILDNHNQNDLVNMQRLNEKTTPSENYTYQKIYNECLNNDMRIFYFHSKGITSYIRMLKWGQKLGAEEFKKYYYWRQFLNWGGIQHWKTHLRALKHHDVSGVNFLEIPSPHFSGAFWWSKSEWIRKLPNPTETEWFHDLQRNSTDGWFRHASERYKDEHWIAFKKDARIFNLIETGINPSLEVMTSDRYLNK